MKLTQILRQQHAGRMFRFNWFIKSKLKIYDYGSESELTSRGMPVIDAVEFFKPKWDNSKIEIVGVKPKPNEMNQTHPNWHNKKCLFYKDDNVLLEGIEQAKCLTKSVGLPPNFEFNFNNEFDRNRADKKVQDFIKLSKMFDAQQEKLPVVKDPARPAWKFPRSYGIVEQRVNSIILSNLLRLCENMSDLELISERSVTEKANFSFPYEKFGDLLQFQLHADILLTSNRPLKPISKLDTKCLQLPNIAPIKDTITLVPDNIYTIDDFYPLTKEFLKCHPHTIFLHYNVTEVKNLYEEPITEEQIIGRSLMKAFTVAASYARMRFGKNVKDLPEPVAIQCVQTDGRSFYFSLFQLNTLNFDSMDGVKNVWYHFPKLDLYSSCSYVTGIPTLLDYNSKVFEYFYNFYQNN